MQVVTLTLPSGIETILFNSNYIHSLRLIIDYYTSTYNSGQCEYT